MSVTPADTLALLDPPQREAAQALRGPVAILAGAGAGKTRTIIQRIAFGVYSGVYAPERVLAVTFTRKSAGELQSRLGQQGIHGVQARTFHGAALAQLSYFWGEAVGGQPPKVLPGKATLLAQAAESLQLRIDQETLRDVAAEIEWRKVSMLTLAEYEDVLEMRGTVGSLTTDQLLSMQETYEQIKEARKQIDFEDVIVLTTGMLVEEPRVALQVRERYRFFTVDEYQDVSPIQHALLRAWLGERDDLCVVGDASQTIYSFAGASSKYLLDFGQEFRGAKEIRLDRNHRSSPAIIQVANRLMRDQPGALRLTPTREVRESDPIFEWFIDERTEANAVAEAIRNFIGEGRSAADIGILYRSHAQAMEIERALQDHHLTARVQGAERYFERADVRRAVMEIRAQSVIPDGRPLFQVVSDVIRGQGWTATPPDGQTNRARWEALDALLRLTDEMPEGASVRAFSDELERRSRAGEEPNLGAVTLSTIHAAKGLEWPIVFVIGAAESLLPISYADTDEAIAEERRLFYVALTRARDILRVSGSRGTARMIREPSRFVMEAGLAVASTASQ